VLTEFEDQMNQTSTKVHADFSQSPALYYSKAYLESLFRNMISTAIKYRSDARPPQLKINVGQEEGFVVLTFQVNGQGIDLERNRERLFDPFIR
jgi:C4-dicarboxylate-specific signal transduction histidine kinase